MDREEIIREDDSKGSEYLDTSSCVDWRGRPCKPNKHGGMAAAVFILGLQAFEMMAVAAVGNSLITYVLSEMNFPLSKSANTVTNFVGTVFLLSLFGGFLSNVTSIILHALCSQLDRYWLTAGIHITVNSSPCGKTAPSKVQHGH